MHSTHRSGFTALALLAVTIGTIGLQPQTALAAASKAARPLLATPTQVEAERILRELLKDPALKAEQAKAKADLAAAPIGQTTDGTARLDAVVAEWTNSLFFKEFLASKTAPAVLWATDDTPRTWLGYTLGGVGTSGDNPDHIYRAAQIDGAGRYVLTGRFDPATRPAQFVLSATHADFKAKGHQPGQPPLTKNQADLTGQIALLTDGDLHIAADGSFRVTLDQGPATPGSDHVTLAEGPIVIGFRDVLSDWAQRPAALDIRRLDGVAPAPLDKADLRRRVIANLRSYIGFWSKYPVGWFGGLGPNTISAPVARDGGWGFLAGARFQLKPDEAILITTTTANARYVGIQVVDPWMIASSAKAHQTSLNPAQVRPNADGSLTYVISPRDPGIANWLDTAGLHDGFAVLRWQQVPAGTQGSTLIRDFKVVKQADIAAIPALPRIDAAQRKASLIARADAYSNRTR